VGHYLIGKGFPMLVTKTGYHPPPIERIRTVLRDQADFFYITGIQLITILCIAALVLIPLPHSTLVGVLIAALLLALPAMQCAVDLINSAITAIFDPEPMPKLDFSRGIPAECSTLVTVPTLLLNEDQVRDLVNDLEVRFLANRDPHLHFALLTDLPDSISKPREKDSNALVELAVQLIDRLNAKYASPRHGVFVLLHRHRIFNRMQGVWMGWERKRGKILDLNKLLKGEFDAFPIKAGPTDALRHVRFVLTLDSDTQLPRGTAARLIGTMAHRLNQALVDPTSRIVVDGYGILQPRVGVSVSSASRSRMAAIFSGQTGADIYTRAVSDAYQDLYGEGSFTGKGLYEVETFHEVLNRRFPRNSLLSHDLIEGAYARAGLATDVELIDDYPSHLSAYNRRKHRWVRGDWQIAQWMFGRVPDESGHMGSSPISSISRWKIFDNLRRSLFEPFTFALFVAGWLGLPGGPVYWTIAPLALLFFPTFIQLAFALGRAWLAQRKGGTSEALAGFVKSVFIVLLNLVFLPHQMLLSLDAIVRALVRRFVTGERLLEWETAAQAETQSKTRAVVDRYLLLSPVIAFAVALLIFLAHPHSDALYVAAPILLLWGMADAVTSWLNKPPREQHQRLTSSDESFLLAQALRIWRYFHQFGEQRHNFLIPDNVEEDGLHEAARVSPTNVGLLLNARQAACELGFLTVPEFVALTDKSLATIARLEKYRGHLFNWYDTQTLAPLDANPFVSSVDSGNFVASLYTLHSGALAMLRTPLLGPELLSGVRTHWQMIKHSPGRSPASECHLPRSSASLDEWIGWLPTANAALLAAVAALPSAPIDDPWWITETSRRLTAILSLLDSHMPWLLPEFVALRGKLGFEIPEDIHTLSLERAVPFAEQLYVQMADTSPAMISDASVVPSLAKLLRLLPVAIENLKGLARAVSEIAQSAERLAEETDFSFLADPGRRILSIGFDVRREHLHDACYDMLASEARIATFLAVARGDIPQQSWFKMGRSHTSAFGRFVLLSWTGTMFEYLMPSLWMRSYPDTLVARSLEACVQIQRDFARSLNIHWGISESGAARKDDAGHYHYQAYGIPQIALSGEASPGPIVSPYSSFLALGIDVIAALRNLRRMAAANWCGAFGFYEAGDYSTGSGKPVMVREWMAHHQGMSLLAIVNLLHDNIVQTWFHASPLVQSTELLLHEMPMSKSMLRASLND
jgi:hypothetical protein